MRTKDSKAFVVAIPLKVSQFQQMRIGTLNMSQGTFIRGKQGLLASERHWHEPHWSRELWHTCPWSKKANKMCYLMSKMVFMQQHFGFECCNSSFSSWLNCGKASQKKKHINSTVFSTRDPERLYLKEQSEEKINWKVMSVEKNAENLKLLRLYWTTTIFSLDTFCREHSFPAVNVTELQGGFLYFLNLSGKQHTTAPSESRFSSVCALYRLHLIVCVSLQYQQSLI